MLSGECYNPDTRNVQKGMDDISTLRCQCWGAFPFKKMSAAFCKIQSRSAWPHLTALLCWWPVVGPGFPFHPCSSHGEFRLELPSWGRAAARLPPRNPGERVPRHSGCPFHPERPSLGDTKPPSQHLVSFLGKTAPPSQPRPTAGSEECGLGTRGKGAWLPLCDPLPDPPGLPQPR